MGPKVFRHKRKSNMAYCRGSKKFYNKVWFRNGGRKISYRKPRWGVIKRKARRALTNFARQYRKMKYKLNW